METILLSDWQTIRGANTVASVTQGAEMWSNVENYQDAVFWLEVKETTSGGATAFTVNYETSPTRDESFFTNVVAGSDIRTLPTAPVVTKALLASATVPIARWLRWKIAQTGATGTWSVTFRLWAAVNRSCGR